MRKILSLLLCVAMLCSLVVITAQAEGEPYVEFENAVVPKGGSITMDINLNDNPGLTYFKIKFVSELAGVTYSFTNTTGGAMVTTPNSTGVCVWDASENYEEVEFGTVTINIPTTAELGEYTFTAQLVQGVNADGDEVDLADDFEFTITVINPTITGVNASISTGISIGIHANTTFSITAVNEKAKEFTTLTEYVEDGDGGYIFYLNVNPWAMDAEFKVDFTSRFKFKIDDEDQLDLSEIPETAKTVGILSYCNKLLEEDPSDELTQLIADLLAFGQASQTYEGKTVMTLPKGLEPTEGEWVAEGQSFGEYCAETYANEQAEQNAIAKTKFKFDYATIEFGSKFIATITVARPDGSSSTTKITNARVKVGNGALTKLTKSSDYIGTYTYTFSPADVAGLEFHLYAGTSATTTNYAWSMTYGPTYYASYLYEQGEEGSDKLLDLLEAYYNYGLSAGAYVDSLS